MFHKTVKNKENKIKIVDSCGCEIWAKALVKKLMERVNLKTDEVEICDIDSCDNVHELACGV